MHELITYLKMYSLSDTWFSILSPTPQVPSTLLHSLLWRFLYFLKAVSLVFLSFYSLFWRLLHASVGRNHIRKPLPLRFSSRSFAVSVFVFKAWIHRVDFCVWAKNTREDVDCGTESGKNSINSLDLCPACVHSCFLVSVFLPFMWLLVCVLCFWALPAISLLCGYIIP